ncbi:hypothetical protein [Streptomyces sp. NPDC055912]|uniref:hypothetical protein n=1 Tax=Streptomyces sp. NPDC055912 TaxID=3345660 RepID=UPI0035D85837
MPKTAATPSADAKATKARVRRGDLVIVEKRTPYTVGNPGANLRTEDVTQYSVMLITNLTRAGEIKMVRDVAWSDNGAPQKLDGMLYATGNRWTIPQSGINVDGAIGAARAHTYPNSTTPRAFPSLDAVKAALRPHRTLADGTENITREDVAEGVRQALAWLPVKGLWHNAEEQPASAVLAAEFQRARRVMRKLLKEGGRYQVETQSVEYYGKVKKLLAAARQFEAEDAAQTT